jgi:hypothetical protein
MALTKPNSAHDPLADFCHDLRGPLEELIHLVYILRHTESHPDRARQYLAMADEKLNVIRDAVIDHCKASPR